MTPFTLPSDSAPDVLILGVEWQPRALLRAQLIEEGFDVVATDNWQTARARLDGHPAPRVVVVDLRSLERAVEILEQLSKAADTSGVLVLRAAGSVAKDELEKFSFATIERPFTIGEVAARVRALAARVTRAPPSQPQGH